jgi:hypothetical protein
MLNIYRRGEEEKRRRGNNSPFLPLLLFCLLCPSYA